MSSDFGGWHSLQYFISHQVEYQMSPNQIKSNQLKTTKHGWITLQHRMQQWTPIWEKKVDIGHGARIWSITVQISIKDLQHLSAECCSQRNALEFGCRTGLIINYIQHFSVGKDKDNSRFIGIEPESMLGAGVFGSEPYLAKQVAMNIFETNQSVLDSFGTFEVVISSEVAEHIDMKLHAEMIDFLVNKTEKYLVFGAAPPGQAGTGHISNRKQEDWIKDFKDAGMIYSDLLTRRLRAACWNGWDKGTNTFVMINAEYHKQFKDFENQWKCFERKDVGAIFPAFHRVFTEMIEKNTCNATKAN